MTACRPVIHAFHFIYITFKIMKLLISPYHMAER